MTLYDFLAGAVSFGYFICALFFARAWVRSRDSLFPAFALAFALLGIVHAIVALGNIPTEERQFVYLLRLGAFLLILIAILRKNRAPRAG